MLEPPPSETRLIHIRGKPRPLPKRGWSFKKGGPPHHRARRFQGAAEVFPHGFEIGEKRNTPPKGNGGPVWKPGHHHLSTRRGFAWPHLPIEGMAGLPSRSPPLPSSPPQGPKPRRREVFGRRTTCRGPLAEPLFVAAVRGPERLTGEDGLPPNMTFFLPTPRRKAIRAPAQNRGVRSFLLRNGSQKSP